MQLTPAVILSTPAVILSTPAVILSTPAVILSGAKDLSLGRAQILRSAQDDKTHSPDPLLSA